MQMIPQNTWDIHEVLCKQLGLLAEQSEKYKGDPIILTQLSKAMVDIAETVVSRAWIKN